MYRLKEIQDKLLHLVGWEQSYNPAQAIETQLTQTDSGLFFQGAHPLCTLDNIRSAMPEQFVSQYPEWSNTANYPVGAKARVAGDVYEALTANVGQTPATSPDDWKPYNFQSDYLERETRNGIAKMVQTFINIKQLESETKNLLERRTFFDGAGRINDTIENRNRFVGFEIAPSRSMGVTIKINRIGLQMAGGVGDVRVYVFHSNKVEPYKVIDLNYDLANGGFKWFPVDELYLPYVSDDTNAGGAWFIGYNQSDLPGDMEAINVSKDWSREPCGTCNVGNIQTWRELMGFMSISPFGYKAPADFADNPQMWDMSENIYTNTNNYGMNMEITVGCDLTDFIVSQQSIFADVLQKQVAANMLRMMALNPDVRVNRNQSNVSRMDMLYELDGNTNAPRRAGLGYELEKAYKALRVDTMGIDRVCLGCNNKGVRYRTA